MNDNYLDKIKQGRDESARKAEEDKRASLIVDAVGSAGKDTKNEVTTAIHDLMLATLVSKDPRLVEVSKGLSDLFKEINKASKSFESSSLKDIPKVQQKIVDALQSIPDTIAEADKSPELKPYLESIVRAIQAKDTNPRVSINPNINLSPITTAIESLEKSIKKLEPKEHKEADFSGVEKATRSVEKAITSLRFPTANYILPYKDPTTGKATQVMLDSSGNVPVSGSISVDTTGLATSAKQDTIIGHLDGVEGLLTDIEADTDTLAVVGGGSEATAQRVTIASDSTGVLSVDDNGSSLTVDNAGLTELAAAINSDKVDVNIKSSDVATGGTSAADDADFTAGTTEGTPSMGVYESTPTSVTDGDLGTVGITAGRRLKTSATIDAALPAGTNNIGDVDVLSSALPTGAATSAKQDTGNTSIASVDTKMTDGSQKSQIVDAGGEAVTVTGGKLDVNATISGAGGGVSAIDDSAFAVASDSGTPAMGLFDDTTPDSVDEGDVGVVRMSANRNAYTTIRDAAGNERGVNVTAGNALTVDASATTQPVSGTVSVTGVATAANQTTLIGHVDGVETAIASTNTKLDTVNTNLTTIDGRVDGLETSNSAIQTSVQLMDDVVATLGTTTYTEASTKGNVIGAVRRDANTTLVDTTNEVAPLQVNATGELKVAQIQALPAGTNAIGKLAANDGVDIGDVTINNASGGSAVNIQDGGNSITVDYATTGSGTATGALRVELPTNGTGTVGLNAGTNAIGKLAANSGVDIGDVDVTSAVSATLDHGSNRDIDTAAEQITATSFACKFGVTLTADAANTGILYIGNSDVTAGTTAATDGIPLAAGDSITLPVTNSNIPYAIASANNQVIYWIAV